MQGNTSDVGNDLTKLAQEAQEHGKNLNGILGAGSTNERRCGGGGKGSADANPFSLFGNDSSPMGRAPAEIGFPGKKASPLLGGDTDIWHTHCMGRFLRSSPGNWLKHETGSSRWNGRLLSIEPFLVYPIRGELVC